MERRNDELVASTVKLILKEQEESIKLQKVLSTKNIHVLEAKGYAVADLCICDVDIRDEITRVTLRLPNPKAKLPKSLLRSGSLISLENLKPGGKLSSSHNGGGAENLISGFVVKIRTSEIVVSLAGCYTIAWGGGYTIKLITNDIMFTRMFAALNRLSHNDIMQSYLYQVLFDDAPPRFEGYPCDSYYNSQLNDSQKKAVDLAVTAMDIALIHGPPGTGKTSTVVEIIQQLVKRGKKVMVCGPSNVSVDNIAEKLVDKDVLFIRMGHPARISVAVLKYGKEHFNIARQRIIDGKRVFNSHLPMPVVLATLCGSGDKRVNECGMEFDVVIIDECAQALEAECWIAAIRAPKLILAGDHHQLPPTLLNQENLRLEVKAREAMQDSSAADNNIFVPSLFMRVRMMRKEAACRMLTIQYRMSNNIMRVSSDNIYGGQLVASVDVRSRLLCDLSGVEDTLDTRSSLVYIDTSGAKIQESFGRRAKGMKGKLASGDKIGKSMFNKGEAELAVRHINRLIAAGVCAEDIALVSPYNGQVNLLQSMCEDTDVEVHSIDGFQGCEKEAVVLSMVRSNSKESVGFLNDYRRINVAITRARRHLCVIADGSTISKEEKFLKALIEHLNHCATIRSPY